MTDWKERLASLSPEQLDLLSSRLRAKAPAGASIRIERRPPDATPVPLSFAQERLWFLDQLQSGTPAYNVPALYPLAGILDEAILRRSLTYVVERQESLRTRFLATEGRPYQVIERVSSVPLEVIDLSQLAPAVKSDELQRITSGEATRPFDLERGPLIRALLVHLGPAEHLLSLTLHHIICDGWSLGILYRELASAYEAFGAGRQVNLPPLPIQYGDFAWWQRQHLRAATLERLLAYWKRQLADAPALLDLPTDRPRLAAQRFAGDVEFFQIETALTRRVSAFAQGEGATLFMVLLSVLKVLLQRYSGQDDIIVGSPIANRTMQELEGLIGFFVNTIVIRTQLKRSLTFRALVRDVRETTLGAYVHQDLPFERLVEELHPQRDLSHNPLFQVSFGLQTAPTVGAQATGEQAPAHPVSPAGNGTAKFDLTLVMSETQAGLTGALEYNTDLFDRGTAQQMVRHYRNLLVAALDRPDALLPRLSLLGVEDMTPLQGLWTHGPALPLGPGLVARVAARAHESPDAPAIKAHDDVLTYGELHRRSNQLAQRIRRLKLPPESRVGVCTDRSAALPLAFLSILKAGATYVPLDPELPEARLRQLVTDAGVHAAFTDGRLDSLFTDADVTLLRTDDAAESEAPAPPEIAPARLAYVIFTSGSTGKPKGVMLTHGGLATLITAQALALAITPDDRVLQFASASFDASVFEFALALGAGATLCIEPRAALHPGPALIETINRRQITVLTLPPSSLAVLDSHPLPSLRLLMVAGEACGADLVGRWAAGRRMVNGYGPTEITVWATSEDCEDAARAPAIGRPIANVRSHVLDAELMPVSVGVPGELYIGGPGVARGYLGRPDLTAWSFLPDPFGPPSSRMYRTGDVVRRRADGKIEFLRRADGQIKLRGFRIEPGEIEAALVEDPGIAHAVVIMREDVPGDRRLVGYVVARAGATVDATTLRRRLEGQLPRHMVPSNIVVLNDLPRTATGKLDRRALPPPDRARMPLVAPENPVEVIVCGIWSKLLGVPVGRNDDFFELGGHSLLVTQVVSHIRDVLHVEIPIRRIFEAPTVAQLAATLHGAAAPDVTAPIKRLSRESHRVTRDRLPPADEL